MTSKNLQITTVVLCHSASGSPCFFVHKVDINSLQQLTNGDHLDQATEAASAALYQAPMIAFDQNDQAASQLLKDSSILSDLANAPRTPGCDLPVVVLGSNAIGDPTFFKYTVDVSQSDYDQGRHYLLATAKAYYDRAEGTLIAFDPWDDAARQLPEVIEALRNSAAAVMKD